jgi:hypothetical protein
MVEPDKHSVRGRWLRSNTQIGVEPIDRGRCTIPVAVSGSYDWETRFTMRRGVESLLVLPVGDRNVIAVVGGWGGRVAGLGFIDGKSANENTSTAKHDPMPPRQEQRLFVRVRVTGNQAQVEIDLNSRSLIRWQGQSTSLHVNNDWNLPNPRTLGLATQNSAIIYHSSRLKLISGKATPL